MKTLLVAVSMIGLLAGTAQAQMSERAQARELMQCAGYMAHMRVNANLPNNRMEDRMENSETWFTRASDRISAADPDRERWFAQGGREALDDMQKFRYESLWDRVRDKFRECRRLARDDDYDRGGRR